MPLFQDSTTTLFPEVVEELTEMLSPEVVEELTEMRWAQDGLICDGEVMGCDATGRVIAWGAKASAPYWTGGHLTDASMAALSFLERDRLERDGYRYALLQPIELAPAPHM